MIAVPREDGGVAVHGSLQCPYYIHKALKRALRLNDRQAQVVQAETGGGFGGKEEYPSIIALHAALLALKCGKPVRMIYDRHEDLAATTKRHPAVVTHRTGVKLDGTITGPGDRGRHGRRGVLHADAGRPVARRDPRRRAVPLPERPDPGPGDAHEHATERRVPRVRCAPDGVRRGGPDRPGGRGARHEPARDPPPQPVPAGRLDADRPGAPRERGRVGRARAGRRGSRVRRRPGPDVAGPGPTGRLRLAPRRPASVGPGPRRVRDRDRAGVARRRVHRLGRGQARVGRVGGAGRRRRRSGS